MANEVLWATIREKPQLILDLFNTCLEREHFPKQSRNECQKFILKPKGNDPKAPSSWRPLCMFDSTGKLYERIIFNRVQSELAKSSAAGWKHTAYNWLFRNSRYFFKFSIVSQKFLVSSFEMYNLEGNKMYVENIGLHLRCIAGNVIYNSLNYLIFLKIYYFFKSAFLSKNRC